MLLLIVKDQNHSNKSAFSLKYDVVWMKYHTLLRNSDHENWNSYENKNKKHRK